MEGEIFECAVIGGGVMGSATSNYLSKKWGDKVALFEQFDLIHRNGSSHGESRIIRKTYPHEHYTNLMTESYRLWHEVEAESKIKVFTQTGGISVGRKDNTDLQKLIEASKKYGNPIEVLKPDEVKERFPLTLPPDFIGVYSPESGILNANKAVSMFQMVARSNGCRILERTPIKNIVERAGGVLEISDVNGKIYKAKRCILTGGPWTSDILQRMGSNLKLPLSPKQTTVSYFKIKDESKWEYTYRNFPIFINYETPELYGSPAAEYPNLIKCGAHFGIDCHPDQRTYQPNMEAINKFVSPFIRDFFPGVESTPTMSESCLYTVTPDEDFIIDQIPDHPNILIGCGFSGHGFKLSPIVGKILSDWAINGINPIPQYSNVFSIKRFQK